MTRREKSTLSNSVSSASFEGNYFYTQKQMESKLKVCLSLLEYVKECNANWKCKSKLDQEFFKSFLSLLVVLHSES